MKDLIQKALIEDFGLGKWSEDSGLLLLKPEHLKYLPDYYEFTSINGRVSVLATSDIDISDTRFGYLAYGITSEQREEFLKIMIEANVNGD